MKHIIIEGIDRLGKNSLIEGLCKHFNYDNLSVRHFSKPPKDRNDLNWQKFAFATEFGLLSRIRENENLPFRYFDNVVIFNRSHIGEIVWGPLYRNSDIFEVKALIKDIENQAFHDHMDSTYLIYLYADASFAAGNEDGKSFSTTAEQKQKELDLFENAIEFSIIKKKIKVKVDMDGKFRSKEDILNEIINFIK